MFYEEEVDVPRYFYKLEELLQRKIDDYSGSDVKKLAGLKYLVSELEEIIADME